MQYKFIENFHKSRSVLIGSSDIIYCIPHPEKSIESLAAFTNKKGQRIANTAIDLYEIKIKNIKQEYNFAADMGHFLEIKALAEFIKDNIDYQTSFNFSRGYQLHKLEQSFESNKAGKPIYINPVPYNMTDFKHNTVAHNDYGIAHADAIYHPPDSLIGKKGKNIQFKKNGMTFDLSKPYILEAKSCNYFAFKARSKDQYVGYDISLKNWQGLPLKVFFQIQYQMALYNIDMSYVSLIYNTNNINFWQVKANKKFQKELIQLASYMKQSIDKKQYPKKLALNSKDIQKLYPQLLTDDFREATGKELTEILQIAKEQKYASSQEKMWKIKKNDCTERMSIHLKDTEMIKGIVNDSLQTICKWKKTGGGQSVMGLKEINEREDGKKIIRYLKKNDMIKEKNEGRKPEIKIKVSELE